MTTETQAGALEDREDAGPGKAGQVKLWLQSIDLAGKEEKDWRERAEDAARRFSSDKDKNATARAEFNILFANVQTLAPAVYNSTPIPDVRRRFPDSASDDDEVAKTAAQALERGLSYNIDDYDFNGVMKGVVKNGLLQGRGIPRVRYIPKFNEDQTEVVAEELKAELVEWDSFRHGPAPTWDKVPWIAFEHLLTRDELKDRFGPEKAAKANLDWTMKAAQTDKKEPAPDIFKRSRVWEVWDKEKRQVLFIAPSVDSEPLGIQDDPLSLKDFWPVPKPFYDVFNPDTLIPQVPSDIYQSQAEELDDITARIAKLIKVLRWRGVRASDVREFDKLREADDGELVPLEGVQQWLDKGGLSGAIWLMPIEQLIVVIRELVQQREVIKQTIFELTGVADIMRGQSNPNETLGAQRIKTQFGTLRLQERQSEIQRVARDLMRIKAEIIAEHFSIETLEGITGMNLAREQPQFGGLLGALGGLFGGQQPQPQQPGQPQQSVTWEQVMEMLRSDTLRSYNVDIETDSTIRGDLGYFQENAAQFVQGFGQFISAVGPAVQAGAMPQDVASDLLISFSRQFKLGRQAEDALERLGQQGQQPQQKDPAQAQAEEAQRQAIQQQQAMEKAELELKQAEMQIKAKKLQQEAAAMGQEFQFKSQELAATVHMHERDIASKEGIAVDDQDTRVEIARINRDGRSVN